MNSYNVDVVASFTPEQDPTRIVAEAVANNPGLRDELQMSADDLVIHESVLHAVKLQRLTACYEIDGRDEGEARNFALAVYRQDAEKLGLPEPETLIANIAEGA